MFENADQGAEAEPQAGLLTGIGETAWYLFDETRLKVGRFIVGQETEIE